MKDYDEMKALSKSGQHEEALKICKGIIEASPQDVTGWKYAGKSLLALGKLDQSRMCLEKAISIDTNDPELVKDLGNVFKAGENDTKAIELYNKALIMDPNNAPALNNLGLIARKRGNLVEAAELVKRASDLDQLSAAYQLNLGTIYKESGQLEQALDSTQKSVELNPDNPNALIYLASIYKELGRLDQALVSIRKSLELKPNDPKIHMHLGMIYKELGKIELALTSTLKSINLDPNNSKTLLYASCLYKDLEKPDKALEFTGKSIELNPTNFHAHMHLGNIYIDLGELDKAKSSILKSLEINPNNSEAHLNMGIIYNNLGRMEDALYSTIRSLELNPGYAEAHIHLGVIYRELNELEKALRSTIKGIELDGNNTNGHLCLSQIYFAKANFAESKKSAEVAIELDHTNQCLCHIVKAACLFEEKKYDEALEVLNNTSTPKGGTKFIESFLQTAIKATIYKKETIKKKIPKENGKSLNVSESNDWVITEKRSFSKRLLSELDCLNYRNLSETRDSRYGNGFCSDFALFDNTSEEIKKLSHELNEIISKKLSKKVCLTNCDSFLNIFYSGSGQPPHTHLSSFDNMFELEKNKYSLVYYLDPGDQNCEKPGILKLHEPYLEIVPEKGKIVIIPATRLHSVEYSGSDVRLMIGMNFYAF